MLQMFPGLWNTHGKISSYTNCCQRHQLQFWEMCKIIIFAQVGHKVVLSRDKNQGEREGRGRLLLSAPCFWIIWILPSSSHIISVLCVIPSPRTHMHPVTAFSLWLETTVQAKGTSLSEHVRKKREILIHSVASPGWFKRFQIHFPLYDIKVICEVFRQLLWNESKRNIF